MANFKLNFHLAMKRSLFAVGFAALLATAIGSCTDDNEPKLPPVPDQPETTTVGLSKSFTRISFDGRFEATADTIFFESDNWMLTRVLFSNAYELLYGYDKAFVSDFEGTAPFSTDCGWMHLDYADKRLIITAIESYNDLSEDLEESPHQRYARLLFQHAEGTDTLICSQVADAIMGNYGNAFQPNDLIVSQKGISLTYFSGWFAPVSVTIDGVRHELNTEEDIFADPDGDFSFTQDWVDVKYFNAGDHPESNRKYNRLTLTIAPNTTGVERSFGISFRYAEEGMRRYSGISGKQLAE